MYERWCIENEIYPIYPPDELRLRFYVTKRATIDNVAPSTLKGDLYAIRWKSIINGFPIDLKLMYGLQTTIKGIKREKGINKPDERLPITYEILQKFAQFVNFDEKILLKNETKYNILVFYTAMVTATFGLLRTGEFAVDVKCRANTDPRTLFISDLTTVYNKKQTYIKYFLLRLKISKTDIFRSSVQVPIGHGNGYTDPVFLIELMLKIRSKLAIKRKKLELQQSSYLFMLANGAPVSRSDIKTILTTFVQKTHLSNPERYKGHSFRIGGATSLAQRGVPSHLIQIFGRWKSDCYKLYIRFSFDQLTKLQSSLANKEIKEENKDKIFIYQDESQLHPLMNRYKSILAY